MNILQPPPRRIPRVPLLGAAAPKPVPLTNMSQNGEVWRKDGKAWTDQYHPLDVQLRDHSKHSRKNKR